MTDEDFLFCQTCGGVLRRLSPVEAQRVADRPENFIIDCSDCRAEILADLRRAD